MMSLGPRCKSSRMSQRGTLPRRKQQASGNHSTREQSMGRRGIKDDFETVKLWLSKRVEPWRNRKVRRKFRNENIDVHFRHVELEKLVGGPGWDEQPAIGKYRTSVQERGKDEDRHYRCFSVEVLINGSRAEIIQRQRGCLVILIFIFHCQLRNGHKEYFEDFRKASFLIHLCTFRAAYLSLTLNVPRILSLLI